MSVVGEEEAEEAGRTSLIIIAHDYHNYYHTKHVQSTTVLPTVLSICNGLVGIVNLFGICSTCEPISEGIFNIVVMLFECHLLGFVSGLSDLQLKIYSVETVSKGTDECEELFYNC